MVSGPATATYCRATTAGRSAREFRPEDQADAHLRDLLDRIAGLEHQIEAISRDERIASLSCWVYHAIPNWNPGISLSPEVLAGVARLGAQLELDIYVVDPEPERPRWQPGMASPPWEVDDTEPSS